MRSSLRLHHELLMLALCDEKGTLAFGHMIELGLGGALLTELLLAGRVEIVEEGTRWKRKFVQVIDGTPFREPVLDAALAKLRSAKRRAAPSTVVSRLGHLPKLRHDVARELCRVGVLREDEQQVLLLFRRRVYPTVDSRPERALIARIRDVLEHGAVPKERTATLIALANVTHALAALYDRKALKALKPRLKSITESNVGSKAAQEAVAAAHAAVMAAMTAAVVAAT
jgi:hypothetical protein